MFIYKFFVFLSLIVIYAKNSSAQDTLYVSYMTGDDTNDGSIVSPLKTLNTAVEIYYTTGATR